MSKFYTNVYMRGDRIYFRGYDMGLRDEGIDYYSPYLFFPDKKGEYHTLEGTPVKKSHFNSIREAREYVKSSENIENNKFYGLTNWQYVYIFDNYKGAIDYDPSHVKVGILDIECAADDGFPNIQKADKPLTAITVRCRGRNYVFGRGEFKTNDPNTHYIQCETEVQLVHQFLQCWKALDLDIVTGWNIEFFDIPYLVNRIKALGMDPKKLSPWKILDEHEVEFHSKKNQSYNPAGITVLDYYHIYRKFSFGNQESYKLDYISQVELGEKKIDYSEYGSLLELYKSNHQKFIEYNIHDCVLVERLDDKLKLIEQVMALAYDAKVNYMDTVTTVRPWDVIIHNYLLEQNIVIPQFKKAEDFTPFVGGYVKDPKVGLSKWVVSFDLNSLYPHLIMQYNISPETFVARVNNFPSIDQLLTGDYSMKPSPESDGSWSWTANGCCYRKTKQGFLPALMEKMYDDRVVYKKKMIEAKQRYEKTKSKDDEKLIARYHNMQLAKKIQLNSAYGALGNQYFRWFSYNHAEAITTSGQLSIRWIEKKINEYFNKLCKTTGQDYVIASDTDSIYVTFERLIPAGADELKAVQIIDEFCEKKIQPFINESYQELAEMMNAYQQKMQMKRETIANKGIWKAKKMYILNAWNVEGVQYDEPKLKMSGIEAVRSSTPHACRSRIKEAISIVMNSSESELQDFVENFRNEFNTLPFEDIAFPRGLNGMKEYRSSSMIYKLGTPIQVKGALVFNDLLKRKGVTNIQPLSDGDKIKYAYLIKPNPARDSVISCADVLPREFGLDKYIDRELQFEKSFITPLKSITDIIDWNINKEIATVEEFF
jgi:DNA polymerase elongation subunit (family B)